MISNLNNSITLSIGPVELYVQSLKEMKNFYKELVGLEEIIEEKSILELGNSSEIIMRFFQQEKFKKDSQNDAGLYHTAIVFSSQKSLALAVQRILKSRPELYQGSADHIATEAFYFSDPEGNGVELYYDKPRDQWKYDLNGKPIMGSEYISELEYLEKHLKDDDEKSTKIGIGHIHLKVGDISKAKDFYINTLMFDEILDIGSALFVSKDNYHHHIGLNTWQSLGAKVRSSKTYGLKSFTLNIHSDELFNQIQKNTDILESTNSFEIVDPWGTVIRVEKKTV